MKLLFATRNPGKLRELRRLVEGLPVEVLSPDDLAAPPPEVEEDGATMAENACKKASECARAIGLHALADDSGICVDALYGLPGVRSARWSEGDAPVDGPPSGPAGERVGPEAARAARDEANNDKLLRGLEGVPEEIRGAEYRAVLALAEPGGEIVATVTGTCRGRIATARRGTGGFGYDPLFLPDGCPGRSMAELSAEEKDAVSHRGAAFRRLRPALEALAVDESARRG